MGRVSLVGATARTAAPVLEHRCRAPLWRRKVPAPCNPARPGTARRCPDGRGRQPAAGVKPAAEGSDRQRQCAGAAGRSTAAAPWGCRRFTPTSLSEKGKRLHRCALAGRTGPEPVSRVRHRHCSDASRAACTKRCRVACRRRRHPVVSGAVFSSRHVRWSPAVSPHTRHRVAPARRVGGELRPSRRFAPGPSPWAPAVTAAPASAPHDHCSVFKERPAQGPIWKRAVPNQHGV